MQIKKHHFETIPSTNNWAKEQLDDFDPHALTVITASEQTKGRGRFHRSWVSPKNLNIYSTFVFFIKNLRDDLGNLPQILALSALETLKPFSSSVRIKWPNDLVMKKKKMGGILCEMGQAHGMWGVIAGIGININMPEELLKKIDQPATSLLVETGKEQDVTRLTENLSKHFLEKITLFLMQGFDPFFNDLNENMAHQLDEPLLFSDFKNEFNGIYKGLNRNGSLNLLLTNGSLKQCVSGELLPLSRPGSRSSHQTSAL